MIFKSRKDAKRVKNVNGLTQICIDLKPERCNSNVYINQKIDVTKLVDYVEKLKKEGNNITYFHTFLTAIAKVIYNRPRMNYFIANRHLYEHNNIVLSFVAKVSFDDKSEEIMVLLPIDNDDNIFTISKKSRDKIDGIRKRNDRKKGANSAIDTLGKLPNILRIPIVGMFKWCDKLGILPKSLVFDNIYYSSMILSNLGSIKCGAIYHNITSFGSCSSLATIGEIKSEEIINENGEKEIRKVCEFGINLDERIADGYYFVKSLKMLQYIFDNPKLLEDNINEKIKNDEIR